MNKPTPTRRHFFHLLAAGAAWPVHAQPAAPPARVLLLGLFHFDSPGLDAVRYRALDVMQTAPQAYLEGLADRLAAFGPTKVLLEYRDDADAAVNERYAGWRAGRAALRRNEIDPIGLRVARRAGLARVHGIDTEAPGSGDALWKALPTLPAVEARLTALIEAESRRLEQAHRTLSLRELLALNNAPEEDRRNKGFYMLLNDAAAADGRFLGADMVAHWWQRNLRMYARLQLHAQAGERVLVVVGSGHAAVMRDFLRADPDRQAEDVRPLL